MSVAPSSRDSFRTPLSEDDELSGALRDALEQHFEMERQLGRGGMAVVWLARRRDDGRRVAIKVLRASVAGAIGVQRFLREIQIASEVRATTLVRLEESGEIDGIPYYVMPYAEAGSLRQRLTADRQLSIPDSLRLATDVARALAELHRHGFVHRDIKPENVLLTADGTGLLADYGIAHAITASANEHFTSTGVVLGTPAYMSPEQAAGDIVDARSDQYAWGCVLYEMLAGVAPFHGVSPQAVLARHMQEPAPPLRIIRSSIPPALEAIVMRVLAKTAVDRFESFAALVSALEQIDVSARPAPTDVFAPPAATPARRAHSTRSRALAAVAVVAAVGLGLAAYWRETRPTVDSAQVVVFPFANFDTAARAREGDELALLVGSALDHAEGVKWIDGLSLLSPSERTSASGVSDDRARAVARRHGARYYLTGVITRVADSSSVQVSLHDVLDATAAKRETERGASNVPVGDLAIRAAVRVLPTLTGLDRVVDVSSLAGHPPTAVTDWLLGEREYRRSNMNAAFRHLANAARSDSTLAPAALRAAAAAWWTNQPDTARALSRLALRHGEALSVAQRGFARALDRLIDGRADDAMEAIRPLLEGSRESADAWMLAGEIELHLLPSVLVYPGSGAVQIDSLEQRSVPGKTAWAAEARAEQAFERARLLDTGYTPPLAHLAEIAARRGDAERAAQFARLRNRENAPNEDSVFVQRMAMTERCLRRGEGSIDWPSEVRRNATLVYYVGGDLAGAGDRRARRCGIAAFKAVLAADTARGPVDWDALVDLHGMMAAQDLNAPATRLVDSAVATGMTAALGLYILDAAAGVGSAGPAAPAAGFAAQLFDKVDTRASPSLWLLSVWYSLTGDTARLERTHAAAQARARTSGQRLDSLIDAAAAAYVTLARGDTVGALAKFRALRPTAGYRDVELSLWESLPTERLTYARLLLAHNEPAAAHRVAATFENPRIRIHQLFLKPSLEIRLRAAQALGDKRLEAAARDRLAALRATTPHRDQ